jgi:hypothetical protein
MPVEALSSHRAFALAVAFLVAFAPLGGWLGAVAATRGCGEYPLNLLDREWLDRLVGEAWRLREYRWIPHEVAT